MADRIQFRRDTAANWQTNNPILMEGEVGYILGGESYKLGDGVHAWNELPVRGFSGNIVQESGNSTESVMSQKAVTDFVNGNTIKTISVNGTSVPKDQNGNVNLTVNDVYAAKGMFNDVAALNAAFPDPLVGWTAYVGTTNPLSLYKCETAGTWIDSGIDVDVSTLEADLSNYCTQEQLSDVESDVTQLEELIQQAQLEIGAVPSDLAPTQDSSHWVTSGGVFNSVKQFMGYYNTPSTATQTLESKYIQYTNGNIATASTTTTFTVDFYTIPTNQDIDSVSIYVPKTTSNAGAVYGFVNSLSATKVNEKSGRGNADEQTLTADVTGVYTYLVVAYNNVGGSPTVKFHVKAIDLTKMVTTDDINASYTKTYTNRACTINGEYIDSNGVVKTGYSNFRRSDYIEIYKPSTIRITCLYTSESATVVTFYDSTKTRISGILANSQDNQSYSVPSGAEYMIVSNKNNDSISVTISSSDVTGFNATVHNTANEVEALKKKAYREYYNVLYVGNSFSNNATDRISNILSALSVKNVNITRIYVSGAGLDTYVGYLNSGNTLEATTLIGAKIASNGSLTSILAHDWDVIIFQQKSASAGNYQTYTPDLAQLINAAKKNCTNPNMKIAFGVVWSTYATTYANIISAAKELIEDYSVDIIIPLGTAVENARLTSMATDANSFSSDVNIQHLADGVGKYVANCAFYISIIQPYTGMSIYEDETTTITTSGGRGEVDVTASNRELCQQCAVYADIYRYATLDIENF